MTYTKEQVAKACDLSYQAGADFVKTSTGRNTGKNGCLHRLWF